MKKIEKIMTVLLAVSLLAVGFTSYYAGTLASINKDSDSNTGQRHEIPKKDWNSPPNPWIEAGTNVEPADFVIFQDEDNYTYAKDGLTGKIIYSGNDDNLVLTNAIENTVPGGYIHVKDGHYDVHNLKIGTGIRLFGSGFESTFFDSPTDSYAFKVDNVQSVRMDGFKIRGGGINISDISYSVHIRDVHIRNGENGIRVCNSIDIDLRDISFDNMANHGFCVGNDPSTPEHTSRIFIKDMDLENPQDSVESAMYFQGSAQPITRCIISGVFLRAQQNVENGLAIVNTGASGDIIFRDMVIENISQNAVYVDNSPNHSFDDLETCSDNIGVKIVNSRKTTVDHSRCRFPGTPPNPSYHVWIENSDRCSVSNSIYENAENTNLYIRNSDDVNIQTRSLLNSGWGVYEENCYYGLIVNNDLRNNSVGAVRRHSDTTEASNNTGYILYNHGQATMLDGTDEVTIDHGLDETPDIINVQGLENADRSYYFYIDAINDENFTVMSRLNMGENTLLSWMAEAD